MIRMAITRRPGANFADGITTRTGSIPDIALAQRQHEIYCRILREVGIEVLELPPALEFPDGCFVEDTAVITPELAVISRPGATSRRGETREIRSILGEIRPTAEIRSPGTLDGGDVLIAHREVFIGLSGRTNTEGARQLAELLAPMGYRAKTISVPEGLHLKSSVTQVDENTLLLTDNLSRHPAFRDFRRWVAAPGETCACNCLWINDHLLVPDGFPETRRRLDRLGSPVIAIDSSEFRKMDGGLTCLSLRL